MLAFRMSVYFVLVIFVSINESLLLGIALGIIILDLLTDYIATRKVFRLVADKIKTLQIEILIGDEDDKS